MSNTTATVDNGAGQTVTGQTLLWAIFALALTAMTQESSTARHHNFAGTLTDGSTSAYRSSPVICLCDAVFDLRIICKLMTKKPPAPQHLEPQIFDMTFIRSLLWNSPIDSEDETRTERLAKQLYTVATFENGGDPPVWRTREEVLIRLHRWQLLVNQDRPRPTISTAGYTMSLTLFILGALPQAIKLFAIDDIFPIQVLAAIYLSAIVLCGIKSFLQSISSYEPAKPISIPQIIEKLHFSMYLKLMLYLLHSGYWYRIALEVLPIVPQLHNIREHYGNTWGSVTWMISLLFLAFIAPASKTIQRIISWLPVLHLLELALEFLFEYPARQIPLTNWSIIYVQYFRPSLTNSGGSRYGLFLTTLPMLFCVGVSQLMQWAVSSIAQSRQFEERLVEETDDLMSIMPQVAAEYKRSFNRERPYGVKMFAYVLTVTKEFVVPGTILIKANFRYMGLHPDVQWSSFLLFNVLTFAIYFTCCFGDMTTTQPSWASIFG